MSDQTTENFKYECGYCGRNGEFQSICPDCKKPIEQLRQYTLSEIRSGQVPAHSKERPSGAPPIIVNLPGSAPVGQ